LLDKAVQLGILVLAFLSPFFLGALRLLPLSFAFAFVLLIFTLFLFSSLQKGEFRIYSTPLYLPLLLLLIIGGLSLFTSFNWTFSRNELFKLFTYSLLFFLIVNNFREEKEQNYLVSTLLISATIIALYGLGFYILLGKPSYLIFSTFLNSNCLAGYLIIIIPIGLSRLLISRERISQQRLFFALLILSLCLILTVSRGAWLALIVALIVFGLVGKQRVEMVHGQQSTVHRKHKSHGLWTMDYGLNRGPSFYLLALVILLFIGFFLTKPTIRERTISLFNFHHRSQLFRSLVWKGSLKMIKAHPFLGTGIGTFEVAYPNYKFGGCSTKMAHNTYLQMGVEMGVLGIITYLSLIVTAFFIFRERLRESSSSERIFLGGLLSGSVAFLIHNLVDYSWYIPATGGLFWIVLALAIVREGGREKVEVRGQKSEAMAHSSWLIAHRLRLLLSAISNEPSATHGPWTKKGGVSLLIVVMALAQLMIIKVGLGDFHYQRGKTYERKKNLKLAKDEYEKAVSFDSKTSQYHLCLGRVYREGKEYKKSKRELIQAVSLEPSSPFNHYNLGKTYERLGKIELATFEFKKTIALHPNYTSPLRILGELYFKLGKKDLARSCFQKILELEKNPYESERYQPIPGRPPNPDFSYARKVLKILGE